MTDDWPDRIIDLSPAEKTRLAERDITRYMDQVHRERLAETREFMRAELDRLAAERREQRPAWFNRLTTWLASWAAWATHRY